MSQYTNTIIGGAMLLMSFIVLLTGYLVVAGIVFLLGVMGLLAAIVAARLDEVSV